MPRVNRIQKEYEQFLIREFLDRLGYRISKPNWQESPDALLTLSKGRSKKRVAIEHTDYFSDTVAGQCSPLTPIDEFWKVVQASVVRRISHRKRLTGILASVNFKSNLPSQENWKVLLAKQFAKELIDFVETHPIRKSKHICFSPRHFGGYPNLEFLLDFLRLSRWTDDEVFASRCSWTCDNISTGGICLNLRYIKSAIEMKNKKAMKYHWGDARERWLLIVASGRILSNHAGLSIQNVNWADADLMNLCRCSPFNRIIFWERSRCWYKSILPDRPLVEFKDSKNQLIGSPAGRN